MTRLLSPSLAELAVATVVLSEDNLLGTRSFAFSIVPGGTGGSDVLALCAELVRLTADQPSMPDLAKAIALRAPQTMPMALATRAATGPRIELRRMDGPWYATISRSGLPVQSLMEDAPRSPAHFREDVNGACRVLGRPELLPTTWPK